jgi:hypothetical protein
MTDFKDPDFSAIDALPDPDTGPKLSTELDQLSTAIRGTAADIDVNTKGRTPSDVVNAAGEAAAGARDLSTNAAIIEEGIRQLRKAKKDWDLATIGARAEDLTKAEKAVTEAKEKLAEAQKVENDERERYNIAAADVKAATTDEALRSALAASRAAKDKWDAAIRATQKASEDLEARRKEFNDMLAKRKAADEAFNRARDAAVALVGGIAKEEQDGGGYGKPGATPEAPGSGYGRPGTVNLPPTTTGPGVKVPAPKVGGHTTPGTTTAPGSTPPKSTDTGAGKNNSTPDAASLAAAQALLNQQGQQQTPQQAQAAPAATQPQQAQQSQQEKKGDGKSDLEKQAEQNDRTVLGLAGLESPLGVSPVVNASGPSTPQSAPSGQNGTSFRPAGTPIPGTTPDRTPLTTTAPPTTGSSITGLNTQTDTSGRSTPPATAYDPTKTTTSGAHGNATAQHQAATQQAGKGQMPMMPMTPMGAMPPGGGGGGAAPRKSEDLVQSSGDGNRLDHGQTSVSEAVRGGTIAQNRPDAPDSKGGKAA